MKIRHTTRPLIPVAFLIVATFAVLGTDLGRYAEYQGNKRLQAKEALEAQRVRAEQQIQNALRKTRAQPAARDTVTKANYDALHDGMTIQQVIRLAGRRYSESTWRANLEGAPTPSVYRWENEDGTGMTVYFQNEILTHKSFIGLH